MRDGRLSASSRSMVLKSCGILTPQIVDGKPTGPCSRMMLSESVIPNSRSFKHYLPVSSDSTLFRSPLPRAYSPTGSPIVSTDTTPINNTPMESQLDLNPPSPPVEMEVTKSSPQADDIPRDSDTSSSNSCNNHMNQKETKSENEPNTLNGSMKSSSQNLVDHPSGLKEAQWHEEYNYIDCEWSMRTMDALFNASFVDFIKNEKNCEFNGRHIAHLVKDYKLDQVVHGLKWLVDGWSIEGTARVLKNVFDDWLPELAAFAIARIGSGWTLRPKMGLIVAFMMMGESPGVAALFIRSLTIGWDSNQITELISCLDTVLEWEDDYFTKFTEKLLAELNEASNLGEIQNVEPAVIITALSSMYKQTTAMTNHRILMADLRLAVAKAHYLTQFAHSISCQECLNRRECNYSARSNTPSPASVIAAMRNRVRSGGLLGLNSNGAPRSAANLETRTGNATLMSADENRAARSISDGVGSSSDFAYLLERIPAELRHFFGSLESISSHEEFSLDENLLFDADMYEDLDMGASYITSRSNSEMSMPPSMHTASQFSRGTSNQSFLLARGHSLLNGIDNQGSQPQLQEVPNNVFDAQSPPPDEFRQTASLMSMALSTLELTDIPDIADSIAREPESDEFDGRSIADPRRVVFSRGAPRTFGNPGNTNGASVHNALFPPFELSRENSFHSIKSNDDLNLRSS